jgi:hypothetical protein
MSQPVVQAARILRLVAAGRLAALERCERRG